MMTDGSLEKRVDFDPDLSPDNPHNQEVARHLGLQYDRNGEVYRDEDGCPARDKFGQPLG